MYDVIIIFSIYYFTLNFSNQQCFFVFTLTESFLIIFYFNYFVVSRVIIFLYRYPQVIFVISTKQKTTPTLLIFWMSFMFWSKCHIPDFFISKSLHHIHVSFVMCLQPQLIKPVIFVLF